MRANARTGPGQSPKTTTAAAAKPKPTWSAGETGGGVDPEASGATGAGRMYM